MSRGLCSHSQLLDILWTIHNNNDKKGNEDNLMENFNTKRNEI